ncbi:MAG: thiamine phosphate synthase [Oscillospiraceae bacterium]|nr:thiamine phosphate synthase [Oscillospiraceae bacterium]
MKPDVTLYFVTDSTGIDDAKLSDIVEKACKGGVTLVQLREKDRCGRDFLALASQIKTVTDRFNIPLIINDRVDIALACDAAGVHVGNEDIPVSDVRKLIGPEKIVGATAKSVEQAVKAQEAGADYLGVGAIFPTSTKETILTDMETLKKICGEVTIPVCAIGGISYDNCYVLEKSGIDGIAVVSAIVKSPDPEKASRELAERILSII